MSSQHELEVTRQVQLRLLLQEIPYCSHFDIAHVSQPARQFSGDWCGYYKRPDGGLAVAIADATGKGMPAALLISATVVALAEAIEANVPPAETLIRTHRLLHPFISDLQSVGVCLAYLDPGYMRIANAGTISPVVRTQAGTQMLVDIGGLPLGTYLSAEWPYEDQTLSLVPGDIVILTTDGIIEATNVDNELYGFERFEAAIAAGPVDSAQAMLNHLLADLRRFTGQIEQHDDLTVVVVSVVA